MEKHPTVKWTVRFDEVMWTFVLTQSFNVHREVHKSNKNRRHYHRKFVWSVFKGLIHEAGSIPEVAQTTRELHELVPLEVNEETNRRRQASCRDCPYLVRVGRRMVKNTTRQTTYKCNICRIGLHPECFAK